MKMASMSNSTMDQTLLSEVLKSDMMKRLLNQPNLVIKTVPQNESMTGHSTTNNNSVQDSQNGPSIKSKSSISIIPLKNHEEGLKDESNFLPSKKEGKSGISLLPIEIIKECDHDEACENIICDVILQHGIDQEGSSPMLAINITEDEINAPVLKHCKNNNCDALSIDHNRCRRAIVKLNRFDSKKCCDICGITLKTHKSRVHHKNCIRKDVYRHNETDGAQILREKMRERELQMIEAAKNKKNDYLDPVTGYNQAMEYLKNNDELIIIPKSMPPQPIVTITSITNPQKNSHENHKNIQGDNPKQYPELNTILGKRPQPMENHFVPIKQAKVNNNQFVTFPGVPLSSEWIQSHIIGTQVQSTSFPTPIRVVPITNLITEPSLLHQTQGIPKFVIMSDNSALTVSNGPHIPIKPAPFKNLKPKKPILMDSPLPKDNRIQVEKFLTRSRARKKDFICNFCGKSFSTDWYFKMHVAIHEGKMQFSCKLCGVKFNNRYDLRKHMITEHNNEKITCDTCKQVCTTYTAYEKHVKTHTGGKSYRCDECNITYTTGINLQYHLHKWHSKVECKYCGEDIIKGEMPKHVLEHSKNGEKITNKLDKKLIVHDKNNGKIDTLKKNGSISTIKRDHSYVEESRNQETEEQDFEYVDPLQDYLSTELIEGDEYDNNHPLNDFLSTHLGDRSEDETVDPLQDNSVNDKDDGINCENCGIRFNTENDLARHSCNKIEFMVCT